MPALLFRVSFTGELGFEVNVPADYALSVWESIYQAGAEHGITAYGTEAMHVLRAEKGYIIIGQETDGTATADDVGLGWAVSKIKPDFVGKRSLARAAMSAPDRRQLVGVLTTDPQLVLEEGTQLMLGSGQRPPARPIGHVTSSYYSATLERSIALAMLAGGRCAYRPDTVRARAPAATCRFRSPRRCSSIRKESASMAELSAARRAPMIAASPMLRLQPPAARHILRGAPAVLEAAGNALGLSLSMPACRASVDPARAALWLGPDERLLLGEESSAIETATRLRPGAAPAAAFAG